MRVLTGNTDLFVHLHTGAVAVPPVSMGIPVMPMLDVPEGTGYKETGQVRQGKCISTVSV